MIGVIVELLSLIPSILLVQLFQRLRPRQQQLSSLHQILHKINPQRRAVEQPTNYVNLKKTKITFPWWCIFIAYGLSFLLIALSVLFIIARGIQFGDLKTRKWLTSILSGFFSSILLIQPIKV
jgi:hypothetical protein